VNAGVLAHAIILFHEGCRRHLAQRPANDLRSRHGIHHFHLRVPGFNTVGQVHRQHADADGFHNVFVEVFQALIGQRFLLQGGIQLRVLNSNAHISRERLQQLHVFVGKKVALHDLAQPQHGDHTVLHSAGDVIVQVKLRDGLLGGRSLAHCLPCAIEEKMALPELRAVFAQEAQVKVLGRVDAE